MTPRDAAALSLGEVVSELGNVTDSLIANLNGGSAAPSVKRQQPTNSAATTEPETTPAAVPATISLPPVSAPIPEGPPTDVQSIASIASIPSRQQLLTLIKTPLLDTGSSYHSLLGLIDTDSFAVVRASPEGWKILGISWIWWMTGFGAVWIGNRLLKLRL